MYYKNNQQCLTIHYIGNNGNIILIFFFFFTNIYIMFAGDIFQNSHF